jgi:hypothetical protein
MRPFAWAKAEWLLWIALSLAVAVALGSRMTSETASKQLFLPGETTHGHYQIELSCASCHTQAFTTTEGFQKACVGCHGEELEEAKDSHPQSKFTDPRHAERASELDARFCITCHSEHQPATTGSMGLSLPHDYCYRCHQDVAEERASHQGLPFDSCANTGCHNFHDNRALYEDFLVRHGQEPDLLAEPFRILSKAAACPSPERTSHAGPFQRAKCVGCHGDQVQAWESGRHGMRVAAGLSPMQPGWARLPMHASVRGEQMDCSSCHALSPDASVLEKEVETCERCHADEHTKNYRASAHFGFLQKEISGRVARGSGTTCVTCHMPRKRTSEGAEQVNHNQNENLRPREKMVRSVCGSCHGLSFALDALADDALVRENFKGRPTRHLESIQFALRRAAN